MLRSVALCALLVLAPIAVAMPATASTSGAASSTASSAVGELPDCDTTVRHEAFRYDNETVETAKNGTATNTQSNTEVSLDTNVAFVHLNAENPNGYCVRYIVEISPEVISPAELGHIDSNDDNKTAHWRAIHDLEEDQTYTQVEFVLQGGENATFAPSQVRVRSLKWTGTAKNATSGGLLPDAGSWFSGDDDGLEQREYTFSAENESDVVPISLRNESLDREVENYNALYRTDDGNWRPVGTDTSDPVFKRELDGGQVVEFHFNNPSAEVKFVANPTGIDDARHSWHSYTSGIDFFSGLLGGGEDDNSGGILATPPTFPTFAEVTSRS